MTKSQRARLDSLLRIRQFLDANDAALGTVNKATSRTDLDQAVTQLEAFAADQSLRETELTGRTKVKKDARDELRLQHMQPIAAIAKKKLGSTPVIQDLKLPAKSVSDTTLVADGRAMSQAAAQYTQTFIDQTMPADFLAQLKASVQALQDAVAARALTQGLLKKATDGVKNQFTITHTDVKVLNSLVVKALKGQTSLQAMWKQMKRVKAVTGTPTVPAPTPSTTTAPAEVPVIKAA